jgi:hypothetical protein
MQGRKKSTQEIHAAHSKHGSCRCDMRAIAQVVLTRRRPLLRKTRLRPISAKRRRVGAIYTKIRQEYLTENPICQVCHCSSSSQIHHMAGRVGSKLNDVKDFLAVCFNCHRRIHDNPAWAVANKFLVRTAPDNAGLPLASY